MYNNAWQTLMWKVQEMLGTKEGLLDSKGKFIKYFVDYKSANHYRNMYNRPDWCIARYNY